MNKKAVIIFLYVLLLISVILPVQKVFAYDQSKNNVQVKIRVAVEYTNHAASFYYAENKKMFHQAGIEIDEAKIFASGVAVAAAFIKEDFDAGYMCLVPAIFTDANGGVPLIIIAGTH